MRIFMHGNGILIALVDVLPCFGQVDAPDPVRRARGRTSEAEMPMTVVRPTWQREMSMKTRSEGNDLALALIIAPTKEKNIAFDKPIAEGFFTMQHMTRVR